MSTELNDAFKNYEEALLAMADRDLCAEEQARVERDHNELGKESVNRIEKRLTAARNDLLALLTQCAKF
jgi:hypothetical protein